MDPIAASTGPPVAGPHDVCRHQETPTFSPVVGIVANSAGPNDPLPPAASRGGANRAEVPSWLLPEPSTPEADPAGEVGLGASAPAEGPAGLGLMSRVLPLSGDLLKSAVDEMFDRFDAFDLFDPDVDLTTRPIATIGGACLAVLGGAEVARRVLDRDPQRVRHLPPRWAMVPVPSRKRSP